jgi:hypothetical protein
VDLSCFLVVDFRRHNSFFWDSRFLWPLVPSCMQLVCNDACVGGGSSDSISPVYSLWATFIGLYIANYVVERSTGWALTHPQPEEDKTQRNTVPVPDFLDMVPWYSGWVHATVPTSDPVSY